MLYLQHQLLIKFFIDHIMHILIGLAFPQHGLIIVTEGQAPATLVVGHLLASGFVEVREFLLAHF